MIVRELELWNIRSYEHALVQFPLGRTLFEGDIGSGKSTMLMAMEFALFGLGSETGASLLRLGEREGSVRLKFEVDGAELEVRRGLERRGRGVQQTVGHLIAPEEEFDLSPSELKEKVLELLEFNEAPDPRAQSLIYRYAVYTPQEEMKGVLSMSPDLRLQTLRRAFRVEDYRTATENAAEMERQLRGDSRALEVLANGVERTRRQLGELSDELGKQEKAMALFKDEEVRWERTLAELKDERQRLLDRQLAMEGFRTEKQMQERLRKEGEREISGLESELVELRGRRAELIAFLATRRAKRPSSKKTPAQLRATERERESELLRLTALKAGIESKLEEYGTIMQKGVCPVCDRPVEAHDFARKKASKELERRHVSEALARAETALEDARETKEAVENYASQRESVAEKRRQLAMVRDGMKKKESSLVLVRRKLKATSKRLGELGRRIRALEDVMAGLAVSERRIGEAEEELRRARERLATTAERITWLGERKAEVASELAAKEDADARRGVLREAEIWLGDYFEPTVQLIERSVLAAINQEFDSLFQRWFGMLVGDPDKEVKVDEDFTPIVSQGGYEQEVGYLSGGERTSVALAYRLALNSLAQRVSSGMKSNLLVLDEPTDGFSHEQLGNVREVLDDVGCPQVIVVSHDKELESFADQIYRVDKAKGRSVVRLAGS